MILDSAMAAGLVGLALAVLGTARLQRACQLFIVFSVLLAASWLRLASPALALAELLIGAIATGGLLLWAQSRLPENPRDRSHPRR